MVAKKLRPWQVEPANRLLDILRTGNAVDMSSTGVGKTAHAAHVIAELKLPTLVIAPKIARTSWLRMLEHFGTSASVTNWEAVSVGKSPYGQWEKPAERGKYFFVCQNCLCKLSSEENYFRCSSHPAGIHCFVRKPVKQKRGHWTWSPQIKFIVADECHRANGLKSLNAQLVIAARRQGIKIIGLSATLATTPLQMRAWGYALDLFANPDAAFYNWTRRHSCGRIPNLPGWHWKAGAERQAEIMRNIHNEILPDKGVRVRTQDIQGFPDRIITTQLYDIESPQEIDSAYAGLTAQHPLTKILRARQQVELLKVPLFEELANDYLAKGNSVAIFVCFSATIAELRKRLPDAGVVDGSPEGVRGREDCISSFQANASRIILLNSAAGGISISLHDTHGGHPRIGLVSPSFSAVEFSQVAGRLHRVGGKSPAIYRVVLAANTIEEKIKSALDKKLNCLESLCDGDLTPI